MSVVELVMDEARASARQAFETGRGLTPTEAAAYLGLSVSTINKLRVAGDGPRYVQAVPRGAVRYRISDLNDWMTERTVTSTSER